MKDERLLTPGPTEIPDAILDSMRVGNLHHRTEEFEKVFCNARAGLRTLFQGASEPLILTGSGTLGMEASLRSLTRPGDSIICINAGKFGERWVHIGKALSLTVHDIRSSWTKVLDVDHIITEISNLTDPTALCLQYVETSTGARLPVAEIACRVRTIFPNILIIVDAISALATMPMEQAQLDIDVIVGGSQKALMLPPGLAFVSLSERAWGQIENTPQTSLYMDLLRERSGQKIGRSSWTPAIQTILGLHKSLELISNEGLGAWYRRHQQLSSAARAGFAALGWKLVDVSIAAPGVTLAFPNPEIDAALLRTLLAERAGIRVAGGQNELKGKVLRLGHMGMVQCKDILEFFARIEDILKEEGLPHSNSECIEAARLAYDSEL